MSASLSISIAGDYSGNVSASATLRGDVSVSFKIAGTRYNRTLADLTANVSFTKTSNEVKASASLRVKVLGIVFKGSVNWSMAIAASTSTAPVLYSLVGDTLYLNMGSLASNRGSLYAAEENESFSVLTANPDPDQATDDSKLYISALGFISDVNKASVNHIVVTDAGLGDDFLFVDSGIAADVRMSGGDGDDVIYAYSEGSHLLYGGNGDDVLRGGNYDDVIYGESGSDDIGCRQW
jgi:Ca2+-binding RTX toxin-like protein